MIFAVVQSEEKAGSCKDMLQGFLTGQLSSALGGYQVEALRREFKNFTDIIEKSIKGLKGNVETKMRNIKRYVGGSHYTHTGAAVEPLCLPKTPEWGIYRDGTDGAKAYIYGAEYETNELFGKWHSLYQHDVPCSVCLLRGRSVVQMFPGRKTCDNGWKLEYHGYLMAGYHGDNAGTTYKCVDSDPDTLQGSLTNNNGYLFYMVEARCGSLKCPPYVEGPSNWRTKYYLGFSVYVSNTADKLQGTLCYKDSNFTLDTIPAVFTTTCPVHGQYVIYYNERLPGVTYPDEYSDYVTSNLCEVEVYGE
uniref:Short-chain collagen C4-like n=1 Tax=Magallana gigas TaxID=29159 RepID=K1Q746_MAGGI